MAPKTGKDFLESTSFQISQDPNTTGSSMKSIFKQDYPPYASYGRGLGARPPPLSKVMHRDDQFFREKESETAASFDFRGLPVKKGDGSYVNLSSTNFKMDSDLNKFGSFKTMHRSDFPPKMNDNFDTFIAPTTRDSHIPQGDREKEPQPLSDYRQKFQGHDTTVHKIEKVPPMHEGNYVLKLRKLHMYFPILFFVCSAVLCNVVRLLFFLTFCETDFITIKYPFNHLIIVNLTFLKDILQRFVD